jgi:RNA recognition motif-containing protein
MSSRGRSPSPRSITSSGRAKKESNDADVDIRKDRSVSRGRDGKFVTKSQSRSRSRGRTRSKSNASMRSRSRSRSASRSPVRSRNRSIPPPRIPNNESRDSQPTGRGPAWRVVIVSGLTKNVRREHLEEIFGKYGRITGVDLPIFAKCKLNSELCRKDFSLDHVFPQLVKIEARLLSNMRILLPRRRLEITWIKVNWMVQL